MLAVRRIELICWYRLSVWMNAAPDARYGDALTGRAALQLRTAAAASALLRVRPSILLASIFNKNELLLNAPLCRLAPFYC